MKTYIPYSLLLAAASCGLVLGAETAYTTPVGYVTLPIAAEGDTYISPALERPTSHSAASSTNVAITTGNNVGTTGLTASALVTTPSYLQVTSGSLAGRRYPITANTGTVITVDPVTAGTLQSQGFAPGNTFKVVPSWTLATLFPNGTGVCSTADINDITSFVFVKENGSYGTDRPIAASYFYCSGDVASSVVAGWYDANNAEGPNTNDLIIDPTLMYFIRNTTVAVNSVTVTGQVPNVASVSLLPVTTEQNDVYLGLPIPLDMTLQQSGLQSAIQGTADINDITEFVFVYDDTVSEFDKPISNSYFYCTGDVANSVAAGWYDANSAEGPMVTAAVLKAGRSFFIRKAAYGSDGVLNWNAPLNYTP
jgi:uncharacterized protein (TIGR02597 family)